MIEIATEDERGDRRRWWVLAVLSMSLLIVGIDSSILNVALPTLVRELGASTSQLQWIVDSYVVVFAGLLLVMGSVGDRFGHKGVLSAGLVVFGVASAAASQATTADQVIVCRAVMGIGGAMIMPATLAILANVFTDPRERRRAIAYWSVMNAAGTTVGPITGGLLLRQFWWGSVFLVNVPVVLVALLAGKLLVPTSRNPGSTRLDLTGAVLSTVGLSVLLWAIISGPEKGWASGSTVAGFVISAVIIVVFVVWELRVEEPMLNVRFFADMRLTAASSSVTIAMVALTGMMFLVSQLLQFAKGYSPLNAALRVSVPLVVVNMLVMPITPGLTERFGPKRMVAFGLVLTTCGLVAVSFTNVESGYMNLLVGFLVMATGFSLFLPAATDAIMGTLPREFAGSGSAINQTSRQVGQALGIAIGGSIAASGFRSTLDTSAAKSGVSADLVNQARQSIVGSYRIAEQLSESARRPFLRLVNTSFVHGFHLSLVVSALTALAGAIVAFVFLPGTLPSHELNLTEVLPTDLVVDDAEFEAPDATPTPTA